jgi:hypothetical protein
MIHGPLARLLGIGDRSITAVIDRLGDASRVLSFARGLLEFRSRPDDVFIVTYPRSGTTLMQFMLHQLAGRGDEDFDHISQVAPWFERSLAVGALQARDLEALPSPRIFKSHLAHGWLPGGGRYIYVTRDGRDVAVSYYHFYRSHLRYSGSFEQFFARFLRGDLQYGSWFKHTAGWTAHRDDPRILFLRFEDLVCSLPSCIRTVARFCELELCEERLAEIAHRCSFEWMKRHEERFDFTTERLLQLGYRRRAFLRSGRTGEGIAALRPEQEAAFRREAARPRRLADVELDLPQFLH